MLYWITYCTSVDATPDIWREGYPNNRARRMGRQSKAPNCDDRHFALPVTGIISHLGQINPSKGNLLSVEGAMIDVLFNIAVFATLGLCIVGFGAWAQKRVP